MNYFFFPYTEYFANTGKDRFTSLRSVSFGSNGRVAWGVGRGLIDSQTLTNGTWQDRCKEIFHGMNRIVPWCWLKKKKKRKKATRWQRRKLTFDDRIRTTRDEGIIGRGTQIAENFSDHD